MDFNRQEKKAGDKLCIIERKFHKFIVVLLKQWKKPKAI